MLGEVRGALLNEQLYQTKNNFNQTVIDGYSGFIFKVEQGGVFAPPVLNKVLKHIIRDYNAKEEELAKEQHRVPELLPHFSVHNLRHTFCIRFCDNKTNLKIIQEIMGHADISSAMYTMRQLWSRKRPVLPT